MESILFDVLAAIVGISIGLCLYVGARFIPLRRRLKGQPTRTLATHVIMVATGYALQAAVIFSAVTDHELPRTLAIVMYTLGAVIFTWGLGMIALYSSRHGFLRRHDGA